MLIHQGEKIEKVIRRTGPSLTDLAKLMNVNRRSIYNWFMQKRLKPEIIIRIGRAIGHDFSVEFPGLFISDDFKVEAAKESESENNITAWQEKYIDLLERYNDLLELKEQRLLSPVDPAYNVMFADPNCIEFKLKLNYAPSELFLKKCESAGYKIRGVIRGEIQRERILKQTHQCITL